MHTVLPLTHSGIQIQLVATRSPPLLVVIYMKKGRHADALSE